MTGITVAGWRNIPIALRIGFAAQSLKSPGFVNYRPELASEEECNRPVSPVTHVSVLASGVSVSNRVMRYLFIAVLLVLVSAFGAACNCHSPTASAANASGFLLTALSNARTNTRSTTLLRPARVR